MIVHIDIIFLKYSYWEHNRRVSAGKKLSLLIPTYIYSFFESHSVNSVVMNPVVHVNIRRKKVFAFLNFV